jgi:hypothetical protein
VLFAVILLILAKNEVDIVRENAKEKTKEVSARRIGKGII